MYGAFNGIFESEKNSAEYVATDSNMWEQIANFGRGNIFESVATQIWERFEFVGTD